MTDTPIQSKQFMGGNRWVNPTRVLSQWRYWPYPITYMLAGFLGEPLALMVILMHGAKFTGDWHASGRSISRGVPHSTTGALWYIWWSVIVFGELYYLTAVYARKALTAILR